MAVASQSALPGDVLYPVKRAIENAQTNLQSDDAAKAQTLIAHAERRLEEAEQLTAEGASATTVAATLQDFTEQSNQATELALDDYAATGDQEAIGELRSFADDSMDDLGNLGDVVPADARPALITAAQSVLQLDSAAFQVCPTCGDGAITELPDGFALQSASLDAEDLAGLLSLQDTTRVDPAARPDRQGQDRGHRGPAGRHRQARTTSRVRTPTRRPSTRAMTRLRRTTRSRTSATRSRTASAAATMTTTTVRATRSTTRSTRSERWSTASSASSTASSSAPVALSRRRKTPVVLDLGDLDCAAGSVARRGEAARCDDPGPSLRGPGGVAPSATRSAQTI